MSFLSEKIWEHDFEVGICIVLKYCNVIYCFISIFYYVILADARNFVPMPLCPSCLRPRRFLGYTIQPIALRYSAASIKDYSLQAYIQILPFYNMISTYEVFYETID